jgi:hypothetical protein
LCSAARIRSRSAGKTTRSFHRSQHRPSLTGRALLPKPTMPQIEQTCTGVMARAPLKEAGREARPELACPNRDKQEETSHAPPWREAEVTSLYRCNACAGLAIPRQSFCSRTPNQQPRPHCACECSSDACQQVGAVRQSAILGTLVPKKRLVLKASPERLLGTLRGKKTSNINKRLDPF